MSKEEARVKTFTEYTPKGKKIEVRRFYYPPEEVWMCADCYHVGQETIIATMPCERCGTGLTQVRIS